MSQVYVTEPQTAGCVIFETTHGPLELRLWSRECPATTKVFLQLCLDGFYDNIVFHRTVPNFLVQTGLVRKKDVGKERALDMSAYRKQIEADAALARRQYELNSRIRFSHRGIVAMALGVEDQDDVEAMQPQIFIMLEEASHLDGKHVILGTISGPTIFNAIRIGQIEVDSSALQNAPCVEKVRIVENPIHMSIAPIPGILPWHDPKDTTAGDQKKKKKKRKGTKNINVLSFGDELEDEQLDGGGIKSSHDLLQGQKKFSATVDKEVEKAVKEKETHVDNSESPPTSAKGSSAKNNEPDVLIEKHVQHALPKAPPEPQNEPDVVAKHEQGSDSNEGKKLNKAQNENKGDRSKEKATKPSLLEARRAKYKKGRGTKRQREEDTMAKLNTFQSNLKKNIVSSTPKNESESHEVRESSYRGQVFEDGESNDPNGWLKTEFKCKQHIDHNRGGDGRSAMDDYEVVDQRSGKKGRHKSRK